MLNEIIEKITPSIKGIGLIFGSYVKGLQNIESDLDIFVVGSYNKEEIRRVARNLGVDINVKCYPLKTFVKNINKDILIKEVLKIILFF